MGEKGNKVVKKIKKKVIMSILVPLIIIILLSSMFFAILDGIVGIIMNVVTTILTNVSEFLDNPIKYAQSQWANFSNWLDRNWGYGDEFNVDEYEKARKNFNASIVVSQEQFDLMVNGTEGKMGLEEAVNRNAYGVGLDDFFIKKMLLTYYRSLYFDDTNVLIEVTYEEFFSILKDVPYEWVEDNGVWKVDGELAQEKIAPFNLIEGDKDEGLGEDGKIYLSAKGTIDLKLQGTDVDLIYYPQATLEEIYNIEYKEALDNGYKDYANSVIEYLKKCYTYTDAGIRVYGVTIDSELSYIEYCNDGIPVILETSKSNVDVHFIDVEYYEKISQFATPLEFMTVLMETTGSQDFINNFIKMLGQTNSISMVLNEIVYEERTEEVTESIRDTIVTGEKTVDNKVVTKEISDKSNVIVSTTKLYSETKYDLVLTKATTWYGEITKNNQEKTIITYTTIDTNGNEVDIANKNEKISIIEDDLKKEYTYESNPWVFSDRDIEREYSLINNNGQKKYGDNADELVERYIENVEQLYIGRAIDENTRAWFDNINMWQLWATLMKCPEEEFLVRQYNYIVKKPQDSYSSNDDYINHINEMKSYTFKKMNLTDTQITKTTVKTITDKNFVQTIATEKDTTDLFLALLSGEDNTYELGDTFKAKKNGGVVVKYKSLYGKAEANDEKKVGAGEMLENGADMLFQLLEKSPNTQGLVDPMRYIMYRYSGIDYGVTEFSFEIYDPSLFTAQPRSGTTLLMEYIHELEGTVDVPVTSDDSKYVIYKDSTGNLLVGHGLNIAKGGYESLFEQAGYSLQEGTEVEKEFVDNLEEEEIGDLVEQVREKTKNLDLKEYQIHALTAKVRSCGITETFGIKNGKTFEQAYNEYWNESIDNLFEDKNKNANFNHNLYTEYMSKSIYGSTAQRKSEWTLFQTGYYKEIDNWYPDTGEMLEKCVEVMNDLLANKVRYSKTDLVWNNIEASNDFSKYSCVCCTYLTAVIYRAGILPAEYINKYNYHTPEGVNQMLKKAGWTLVDASEAQPGDIGTFTISKDGDKDFRHGFIYAGNNEIWDQSSGCISTDGEPPKRGTKSNWSYYVNNAGNLKVWRMP